MLIIKIANHKFFHLNKNLKQKNKFYLKLKRRSKYQEFNKRKFLNK